MECQRSITSVFQTGIKERIWNYAFLLSCISILLYYYTSNGDDVILPAGRASTTSGCELSGLFIIYSNAYTSEDKNLLRLGAYCSDDGNEQSSVELTKDK